ncbi:MAG: CPBP family intramembrane metalloprotease [Spirochaetaceae bacterium]|jgi:membrane protease YdiL (CAAX protease family)|nr:CPBP family intramembrane metalloprotease [Spirochaetaceae bacterium]
MGIITESLILFGVLFLPGIGPGPGGVIPFSVNRELSRIFVYNIPAFALIWYLLGLTGGRRLPRPGLKDLSAAAIALPGLLAIGYCVSLTGSFLADLVPAIQVDPPGDALQWVLTAVSSLTTGYLEESYFRFYLLTRLTQGGIPPRRALLISTALFALCHIYEGFPGVLNALLAGLFLAGLFLKKPSLHSLAWAHGAYNMTVYLVLALTMNR